MTARGPKKVGVREDVPHFVYRCYDASDRLLYIGCSNGPLHRVKAHRETAWWGDRIARVRFTVFPDRRKALSIEREAIWAEQPLCNVKGRWQGWDDRAAWTAQDYLDYHNTILRTAHGCIPGYGSTGELLQKVERELADRFGVHPIESWEHTA